MSTTNRPGRPRIDASAPSVSVHFHMSATMYAKAYEEAQRRRQTVNEWIRDQIRAGTTRPPALEAPRNSRP